MVNTGVILRTTYIHQNMQLATIQNQSATNSADYFDKNTFESTFYSLQMKILDGMER